MSKIAETRSFFLRDKVVNTGANKDNEIGFPTVNKVKRTVLQDGKLIEKYADVGNRFLEGHIPSPSVWEKFLHSIVFKNEQSSIEEIESISTELAQMNDRIDEFYNTLESVVNLSGEDMYIVDKILNNASKLDNIQEQVRSNSVFIRIPRENGGYELVTKEGGLELRKWDTFGSNRYDIIATYQDGKVNIIAHVHIKGDMSATGTIQENQGSEGRV